MMSAMNDDYVAREPELLAFRDFCSGRGKQVLFIHGPGGIGKTALIQAMLEHAKSAIPCSPLVINELVDLNSTSCRYIDSLQSKIAKLVKDIAGPDTFKEYYSATQPTSEDFHKGLESVCRKQPVILGLDTFECIQADAVGEWSLSDDDEGLLVPQLYCIIGSRLPPPTKNSVVRPLPLQGFTLEQARQLYMQKAKDDSDSPDDGFFQSLLARTKGHPLLLRIVFEWLRGGKWNREAIECLSQTEFEADIMDCMHDFGDRGELYYYDGTLSVAEYQAIVLMSYLDRRFNSSFLYHLSNSGYFGKTSVDGLISNLEQLFFVKIVERGEIKLHDEMARLVQQHIWPKFGDADGDTRRQLAKDVIGWYDALIELAASPEDKDNLRAEKLDYVFRYDKKLGEQLLDEYANLRSNFLDMLLPIEARKYVVDHSYSVRERFDIYKRIAELETRNGHFQQATRYWRDCLDLASRENESRWRVESLIGLHNCTWQTSPTKSLESYLGPALDLCQREVHDQQARVEYEIGFAYRQSQDIDNAIEWYNKGLRSVEWTKDKSLLATLLNDLGYAYTFVGEYASAIEHAQMAGEIRGDRVRDIEVEVASLRGSGEAHDHPQRLTGLERELAEARLQHGRTLNTLGEISRFRNRLPEAEGYYTQALTLFERVSDEEWQVRALLGRGEARRRSVAKLATSDPNARQIRENARKDLEDALGLCKKSRIGEIRDTAERRLGRFLHDSALLEKSQGPEKAWQDLQEALEHFGRGKDFAGKFGHELEVLENSVEIAFIADDLARLFPEDEMAREQHEQLIEQLAATLGKYGAEQHRIYQYSVFEDLLRLARGAHCLALGKLAEARDFYVRGYSGLASDPGYGYARYHMHLNHVKETIRSLPTPSIQKEWCEAFIYAWEHTKVQRDQYGRILKDAVPHLYGWCKLRLPPIEKSN
jgi:tetratricopeptide (TPR) repeat protein